MKRAVFLVIVAALIVGTAQAVRPSTQINYQGVLRDATDNPLDGSYSMVFRFFSAEVGADEILVDTHATVTVAGGLFNVKLGGISSVAEGVVTDGSGPGTYTYLPAVFGAYADVFLEVEVNGEVLSPRTRIVSAPSALNARYVNGVQVASSDPLTLYVDAVTGEDGNSGLFPDAPKQTIQAAIDRIPSIIGDQVTVYIADGTYHESVFIDRRLRRGLHRIALVGNESTPENVTLDGQQLLDIGMLILDFAEIRGIRITGFLHEGMEVFASLPVTVSNCRVTGNGFPHEDWSAGIWVYDSELLIDNCVIQGNADIGIEVERGTVEMESLVINANGGRGFAAGGGSNVDAGGSIQITSNGVGVWAYENSCVDFEGHASVVIQNNVDADMQANMQSTIAGYGNGTTGTCTADTHSSCDP